MEGRKKPVVEEANDIRWIYLVTFLDFFAVSLLLPSMSLHLNKLGASYSTIGAISSIYAGTQLVSGPIIGSLSDKIGRKTIFVVSCLIISICYTLFGVCESILGMLLLRATIGVYKHSQVMIQALLADFYPKEQQAAVFGHLKSIIGLSFTLGPLIAGHMTEVEGGFRLTCFCAGGFFLINSAIAFFFINDKISDTQSRSRRSQAGKPLMETAMRTIVDLTNIDWTQFGDVFFLKFMSEVAAIAFYANYNVRNQKRFDISPKISGYTIAYQSIIGITTGLLMSRIEKIFYKDDVTYRKRNLHAFSMMAIAFVIAFFSSYFPFYMMSATMFKIADMVLRVTLTEMIVEKASPSHQGSVAGSTESIGSLARLVAPLATGVVEDIGGVNSSNLLSAAASLCGVFISKKLPKSHLKKN